jgi:hypothetical protein
VASCLCHAWQVPEHVLKGVAATLADSQLLTVSEDGTRIKRTQVGHAALIAYTACQLSDQREVCNNSAVCANMVCGRTCLMTQYSPCTLFHSGFCPPL